MPTPSPHCSFDVSKEKHEMKNSARNGEETLAARRKEFINSLRMYRSFYGGLADQLCINQLAAADGQPCWNGEDVVKSYTQRVVGNGIKAQSGNPEVKVKGTDPVINQIIDKLKHVIQLLQGTSPKPNKWELLQPGSGDGMLEQVSGDCDDEDGCGGSGSGEVKKTLKITKWMPDDMNFSDVKQIHRTDHRSTLDSTEAGRASGTEPMTLTLVGLLTLLPKLW